MFCRSTNPALRNLQGRLLGDHDPLHQSDRLKDRDINIQRHRVQIHHFTGYRRQRVSIQAWKVSKGRKERYSLTFGWLRLQQHDRLSIVVNLSQSIGILERVCHKKAQDFRNEKNIRPGRFRHLQELQVPSHHARHPLWVHEQAHPVWSRLPRIWQISNFIT